MQNIKRVRKSDLNPPFWWATRLTRIRYSVLLLLSIAFFWSHVSAGNSALEKAVLLGDWQTVRNVVTDSTAGPNVIYDFLNDISCLALDLDCSPSLYMTSPPRGKSDKTIEKWIQSLRRRDKRNATLSYLMGNLYSRSGENKKALKEFREAIRRDDHIASIFLARSVVYLMMNDLEKGLEDANKAIRLDPGFSMAYTYRSSILDAQQEYQYALNSYADAIRLKPERAHNYYNRANTYRHMKQDIEAISDYTRALTLDSTIVGAYFNRGSAYFDEAELDNALIDYRKFLAVGSEQFSQQIQLARLQIRTIELILEKGPIDKATLLVELGFIKFEQNDYDGAIEQLNKALALDATKSDAYYWRAYVSLRLGEQQKAIDDFTQAIYYHPSDTTAFFNRGALFVETDRLDEAIRDFSSAIELNIKYVLAYENRAKAYESLGHIDSAITDYKAMLNAIPDSAKQRRDDIRDLVEFLANPNKKYDTKEIKKAVKKAYKLWEKQKWAQFANTIFYDDLETFQTAMIPFSRTMFFGGDYEYVTVYGNIYKRSDMVNAPPDLSFVLQMGVLANGRSAFKPNVTIKFIEVTEIIPRGYEHAIARVRIRIDGEDDKQEVLIENNVELIFSGWKIRMPPPIMNVAVLISQVPKEP